MTPFIEKIRKGPHQKGISKGQVWVRESLREHKLSNQLTVLVSNEQHMYRHYFGKAWYQAFTALSLTLDIYHPLIVQALLTGTLIMPVTYTCLELSAV